MTPQEAKQPNERGSMSELDSLRLLSVAIFLILLEIIGGFVSGVVDRLFVGASILGLLFIVHRWGVVSGSEEKTK